MNVAYQSQLWIPLCNHLFAMLECGDKVTVVVLDIVLILVDVFDQSVRSQD